MITKILNRIPQWAFPYLFFITQFISYTLFVLNGRAFNQSAYVITFVSDLFFGLYGFFVIKAINESKHGWAWVGYMLGGSFGSLFGIWVSKLILGA